jgi:alanine racemase
MDQILVDVTGIDNVKLHDNVVCFGRQNGACLPVEEYAALCGTINYEILCALSPRVPRLYYEDER